MKYQLSISNRFKKDLKLLKKRGYNLTYLQEVIDILLEGKELVWITAMISTNQAVIFLLLNQTVIKMKLLIQKRKNI